MSAPPGAATATRTTPGTSGRLRGAVTAVLAALVVVVAFLGWSPLLADAPSRLLAPMLLLAAVVLVPGTALRALRAPLTLVLLAQVLAATVVLASRWAPGTTFLGLLPTPATVGAVAGLMGQAASEAQSYAAPVPTEGVAFPALALALGVVALLLADLLAAGLRRPSLVAMPALVVLTVPVVVLEEPLPLAATVATAAAYALVLAAQHATELRAWSPAALPPRALPAGWVAAGASTALALAVAVALTPLVPSRTVGVTVSSPGASTRVDLRNPIADLRRDLVQTDDTSVLEVTARGEAPTYVRTTVLDVFDGSTWRPGERSLPLGNAVDGQLPLPQGLSTQVPTRRQEWRLRAQGLYSPWLPLPFPARSADAPEGFRYDDATLDAVSLDGATVAGTTWQAVALAPAWDPVSLREARDPTRATRERWTDLPEEFPQAVVQLAEDVVPGDASAYDQAVALQDWFRTDGGFSYSLETDPGTGEDALLRFLGNGPGSRVGYCEQFSASMAVMARSLGIPARVAVGFLSGSPTPTYDGLARTWSFSGQDLHAWPELYFAGSGWVRFEPTPSTRTGQAPAWSRGVPDAAATPEPTPSASATPSPSPDVPEPSAGAAAPQAGADDDTTSPLSLLAGWVADNLRRLGGLGVLAVVLLVLAAPALLRRRRRRQRHDAARSGDVEQAWAETVEHARDLGVPVDRGATVRRTEEVLRRSVRPPGASTPVLVGAGAASRSAGADAGAETAAGNDGGDQSDPTVESGLGSLGRLADAVERARYAPAGTGPGAPGVTGEDLVDDVARVTAAMDAAATPAQRRRARWLPRSRWS